MAKTRQYSICRIVGFSSEAGSPLAAQDRFSDDDEEDMLSVAVRIVRYHLYIFVSMSMHVLACVETAIGTIGRSKVQALQLISLRKITLRLRFRNYAQ